MKSASPATQAHLPLLSLQVCVFMILHRGVHLPPRLQRFLKYLPKDELVNDYLEITGLEVLGCTHWGMLLQRSQLRRGFVPGVS